MQTESFVALLAGIGATLGWLHVRRVRRADFVRRYMFPPGLLPKLRKRYPQFEAREEQLAARALRRFFLAYIHAGFKPVAMPSQVADELWHEFILHTRQYQHFCQRAFGRFLHHSPVAVMQVAARERNAALRRTWWHTCLDENIDPRKPTRLPLLFALDAKLGVGDGKRYSLARPDRQDRAAAGDDSGFEVSVFSDESLDGGTEGFGGESGGGDGDGGGGCGGD